MDNNYYFSMGAAQGWQCPICRRVLSPWTQECPCKGKVEWDTTTSGKDTYKITMNKIPANRVLVEEDLDNA